MKRRNQYNRRTTAAAATGEDNSNDSSTTDQSNDLLSDTADDSLLMPPPPSNKRKSDTTTDTQGIGSSTELISNTTKKKKTSLFSAVISRSSNKSKLNNNAHKKQSIATSTKPSSTTASTNNKMSTPTKSTINNTSKSKGRSPMHSPGGYEILQALDNANLYNDQQNQEEGEEEDGTTTARQHTKDTEGKDEFHDATVYFHKPNSTKSRRSGYEKRETKEDLSSLFLDSSIVEATRYGVDDFNTHSTTQQGRGPVDSSGRSSNSSDDVPNSVGMIDWSIKRRLRLDCIPGNCLPGSSMNGGMKGGLNEGKVRQLAIQQLSSGGDTDSMNGRSYSHSMRTTEEEMAASKWLASTMYYQHPAVHPLPLPMLVDSSSGSTSTTGGKKGDGGKKGGEGKGDLSSYILQPQSVHNKVRLSGVGSMGGLGMSNLPLSNDKDKSSTALLGNQQRRERSDKSSVSTVSSLLYQRRRDWQECFRSMFQLWKIKLKEIESTSSTATSSQDLISRNSFYVISSNQVVLFRGGYMKQHSGDISPQLVPMVVFSSTTPYLRSKLKSMGVELRLFTPKRSDTTTTSTVEESYEVFSESLLQTNNDATPTQEDSAEVHAELNAIKHADDEKGKVTVEVKKRKVRPRYNDPNNSTSGSKGSSLPPLFVYGIDDCNVIYELFMNTYGLSNVDQNTGVSKATTTNAVPPVSDVPLLLCRSLGSNCLHTTLRTLSVSSRRYTGFMNQVYHQDQQQRHPAAAAANAKATLELRGPILPCALRDLTCSVINLMLTDKSSRQQGKHSDHFLQTSNKNDSAETSSSHQFAMFLQVHEGESSSTSMSKMTTGSSSSVNFNGSDISLMPSQEKGEDDMDDNHNDASSSWYECRQGDCINVLVWDVSRTSVVSFHPTEA